MLYHLILVLVRHQKSLFLLSKCTDELISDPKIMTFAPMLPSANENAERESNPVS